MNEKLAKKIKSFIDNESSSINIKNWTEKTEKMKKLLKEVYEDIIVIKQS